MVKTVSPRRSARLAVAVAQVVEPHVGQASRGADASPAAVEGLCRHGAVAGGCTEGPLARAGKSVEHGAGDRREPHRPRPGLAVA